MQTIALIFGDTSERVKGHLSQGLDNYELMVYRDIPDLIHSVQLRKTHLNRILLSSPLVNAYQLEELHSFLQGYSSDTEVVFIIKRDDSIGASINAFETAFKLDKYTPVIEPSKVTVISLLEFSQMRIPELKAKYFLLEAGQYRSKSLIGEIVEDVSEVQVSESVDLPHDTSSSGQFYSDDDNMSMGDMGDDHLESGYLDENEYAQELQQAQNNMLPPAGGPVALPPPGGAAVALPPPGGGPIPLPAPSGGPMQLPPPGAYPSQSAVPLPPPMQSVPPAMPSPQRPPIPAPVPQQDQRLDFVEARTQSTFVVVSGEPGSGISTQVLLKASSAVRAGKKPLIIDLDTVSHGVLKQMSTYPGQSNPMSIQNGLFHQEGGITVLSNGYNNPITESDLKTLHNPNLYQGFDLVLFDCPLVGLESLGYLIAGAQAEVVLTVNGTGEGLSKLFTLLEDRHLVSDNLCVELSKRVTISPQRVQSNLNPSIQRLKTTAVFDRVNWLKEIQTA